MNSRLLVLTAMLASVTTTATAQSSTPPSKEEMSSTQQQTMNDKESKSFEKRAAMSSQEPAGYVLVDESVAVDLQQLPLAFMNAAVSEFKDKNFGEASASVRAAARVLQAEAKSSKAGSSKSEITTAATQLERLALQIKNGQLQQESQLKALFADVAYHLSKFHRDQVEKKLVRESLQDGWLRSEGRIKRRRSRFDVDGWQRNKPRSSVASTRAANGRQPRYGFGLDKPTRQERNEHARCVHSTHC